MWDARCRTGDASRGARGRRPGRPVRRRTRSTPSRPRHHCVDERARDAASAFAGRDPGGEDLAIICRNTTEAISHLAYRLRLAYDDVVATTVVEHHANLLPWSRVCRRRVRRVHRDRYVRRRRRGRGPRRAATPEAPCRHRCVERHRLAASARGDPPSRARARRPGTRRHRASSVLTARCRPAPTTSRGAGTRCTRPSVPGSSSVRGRPSRSAALPRGRGRSTSSTSTR